MARLLFATCLLVLAALAATPAAAQQPPAGRPTVGLALEGGGALGLAHIGVLQWFEENHIPVDRLAGTSMGSLVGGLYASGLSPAQLRALATGNAFESVFTLQSPYADSSFRRRQDRRELPQALTLGLRHHPTLRNALLGERGVNQFLASNMASYNSDSIDFDSLPIPFRCVATDLNTLGPIVFSRGPLPAAVRASISIPGVFPPVLDSHGHSLVDGGIMNNLPTEIVRRELHASIVIAVHLDTGGSVAGVDTSSIVSVLNRAFSAGIEQNVQASLRQADIVLAIPVEKFSGVDYDKGGQLIREGYLAAERNRALLIKFALDDRAWADYLAARQARLRPAPGLLQAIRVEGGDPGAQQSARTDLEPLKGQPIRPDSTLAALKPIQANGGYQASYRTFSTTPGAAPDNGLLVHLDKDPIGPPYLLIAPEVASATSNPLRIALDFRLLWQNLGSFGSELRASTRIGTMTSFSAEYYRLLSPRGWFLQPTAGVSREPVYIWSEQNRIAERRRQNFFGGLDFGRTFSNSAQLSAEWHAQSTRWDLVTGSGGGPTLSGAAQTALLRYTVDHSLSGAISPRGWRMTAATGAFFRAKQSFDTPLAQLSFIRTFPVNANNIFGIGGELNSYFRRNVAEPWRFAIGGPLRLSASSFDEFRGTDVYVTHAGYLRRIAPLPTGLGQGLYASFAYEAGEVWAPERRAILRQDGVLTFIGDTPIGLLTFGVSAGDAGHRKVFFTIGRWF